MFTWTWKQCGWAFCCLWPISRISEPIQLYLIQYNAQVLIRMTEPWGLVRLIWSPCGLEGDQIPYPWSVELITPLNPHGEGINRTSQIRWVFAKWHVSKACISFSIWWIEVLMWILLIAFVHLPIQILIINTSFILSISGSSRATKAAYAILWHKDIF